jgi:hypothetical protein
MSWRVVELGGEGVNAVLARRGWWGGVDAWLFLYGEKAGDEAKAAPQRHPWSRATSREGKDGGLEGARGRRPAAAQIAQWARVQGGAGDPCPCRSGDTWHASRSDSR